MPTPKLFEHDRLHIRNELPRPEAIAIAKCFGLGRGDISDYDRRLARKTLDWLRTKQYWIACGCIDASTRPLLIPAMREGVLYLRRHPDTAHRGDCIFRQFPEDERVPSNDPSAAGETSPITSWEGGWNLSELAANKVARKKDSTDPPMSRNPRTHRFPKLGRVMLSALERAGMHQISIDDVLCKGGDLARPRDPVAIYGRMKTLNTETVSGNLTWDDIHCYSPAGIKTLLSKRLPRLEGSHKIPKYRHQGYFLGVIDELDSTKTADFFIKHTDEGRLSFKVEGRIATFGSSRGTRGPYWVLAHALKPTDAQQFTFVKAYAHPVFSRALPIPVDSDLERTTLDQILHCLKRITFNAPALGTTVIRKPLLDLIISTGEPCRPDFEVVRPDGGRLLIECMGFDDSEYEASKTITHPRMRQLPNVVDLVSYAPDRDHPTVLMKALQTFCFGTP